MGENCHVSLKKWVTIHFWWPQVLTHMQIFPHTYTHCILIHTFVYQQGKQMYYLTPNFQVRHQCVGPSCMMHAAYRHHHHLILYRYRIKSQCPSLCTVKHVALQMYLHNMSLLFLIPLQRSRPYSKYDCSRQYRRSSFYENCHDQQIIYYAWSIYHRFEGTSSIPCILKDDYMHNVLTYTLGEREDL